MSKIIITERQYKLILESERKTSLNEDTKNVLMGVSLLMGLNLTGLNKDMADKALSDESTMSEIKNTLEDRDKTDELIELLKQKGLKNPEITLASKADSIVEKFNDFAKKANSKEKMNFMTVYNLKSLTEPNKK
jgi:hypothetical protein